MSRSRSDFVKLFGVPGYVPLKIRCGGQGALNSQLLAQLLDGGDTLPRVGLDLPSAVTTQGLWPPFDSPDTVSGFGV
jgi:hypothetical protein